MTSRVRQTTRLMGSIRGLKRVYRQVDGMRDLLQIVAMTSRALSLLKLDRYHFDGVWKAEAETVARR